jgi:hypothetical protein
MFYSFQSSYFHTLNVKHPTLYYSINSSLLETCLSKKNTDYQDLKVNEIF